MIDRTVQLEHMLEGFHKMHRSIAGKPTISIKDLGITHAQWMVLSLIARQGSATITDIHSAYSITSSAATQLVNELEKHGYVLKRPDIHDKRLSIIRLSRRAQHALKRIRKVMLANLANLFSRLNDQEFATYMALNYKLFGNQKYNHPTSFYEKIS